jgi:hypothetical protein
MFDVSAVPASFILKVRSALSANGALAIVHDYEMELLAAAIAYGVGPNDTARQLIYNRTMADIAATEL